MLYYVALPQFFLIGLVSNNELIEFKIQLNQTRSKNITGFVMKNSALSHPLYLELVHRAVGNSQYPTLQYVLPCIENRTSKRCKKALK